MVRLIEVLRPWLAELVIIGGWAHRLYRFAPAANQPSYQPLRTRDADIAFSLTAALKGNMGAALEAADFHEVFSGNHTPPVAEYRLGKENQGFYVEFLAPQKGRGFSRIGAPDATIAKAGVTAQKLRHLELLLVQPWTIPLSITAGVPLNVPLNVPLALATDVMVPNPVSFVAQKLLIQGQRTPEKQAQDALYIHDTLDLFGGEIEALKTLWREGVRPSLPRKIAREIERLYRERFGSVTDVIRTAARIPQDRTLTPSRMQAVCAYGLEEIFGAA